MRGSRTESEGQEKGGPRDPSLRPAITDLTSLASPQQASDEFPGAGTILGNSLAPIGIYQAVHISPPTFPTKVYFSAEHIQKESNIRILQTQPAMPNGQTPGTAQLVDMAHYYQIHL